MKKVLIIEDEPDVAETMKMIVERGGYQADYEIDPMKGLEKVKDGYDLLLLDIMMPKMSGRQVLAEMKARKINLPVIVVTSVGLPDEVETELNHKFPGTRVLSKPHMHEQLVGEIRKKIG